MFDDAHSIDLFVSLIVGSSSLSLLVSSLSLLSDDVMAGVRALLRSTYGVLPQPALKAGLRGCAPALSSSVCFVVYISVLHSSFVVCLFD